MLIRPLSGQCDLLALHRADPRRYPCLLESAARGGALARHDLLLAFPQDGLRLDPDGRTRGLDGRELPGSFLQELDAQWRAASVSAGPRPPGLPFRGGWALYLGYELAGQLEPRLRLPPSCSGLPVALALRCPVALVRNHEDGSLVAVAEPGSEALIEQLLLDVGRVPPVTGDALGMHDLREDEPVRFLSGVERVLDYLRDGDVFQVNLSRGWTAAVDPDCVAADLHAALRRANPAPFAACLAWDDWGVASSSPERLVSVRGGEVQTRPIAGTRPRFEGDDDSARIRELVGNPKERAEHIMLIDLERNDLGRICVPGSVEVDELMTVESYAHVHHIVSNVRGRKRPGTTPGETIAAVFPGGTITGCPKVRCMEIIAALEGEGRGAYTGALGYLDLDGDMDLNILIRTFWLRSGRIGFRAGAGIVADSKPDAELAETRAKARGLLRALGAAD